ncbi:gliding motility-associated C-terminal domain-containing protein [Xanthovirga aplysinae]|uniref:T9SS type B sorting domain-containing protein n=1 Tax=Xanthovirga aplysinae TaxID=2529853 RepID=UPI0012BD48E8|nr:gliding motility-associated C-terminal domain-containing protein [Xanthovirga aplysinae]MTI31708.1 gliding motility-associated C-terminal domain-containing protein [Xanthovirga aplysinae]
MKKFKVLIIIFSFSLFLPQLLQATHIRAGEITARRISTQTLTYEFTLVGYTDTEGASPPVLFGSAGVLNFGDGNSIEVTPQDFTSVLIGEAIAKNTFTITHTFQAPGTYSVSYQEDFRNEGILTMTNSVNTAFYIETKILIDPLLGMNQTPVLLIPPIDDAASGIKFIHNPGAFDADGDSLAYQIVKNKQKEELIVDGFKFPHDPSLYIDYDRGNETRTGPPTYTMDPLTGDLIWDAPGIAGEYNVAFIVEEWRKINGIWHQLGYVTRDMQILVEETDNNPPELSIPKDTCIVAGNLLEVEIEGTDEDGDDVMLEAYGGIFDLNTNPASFTPSPPIYQPTPALLNFTWQTSCLHLQARPYTVQFKATDMPQEGGPSLTAFETWNIRVVAPAPEGLTATITSNQSIQLEWDSYSCNNADSIQIWRRTGSLDFTPDNCETGIPEGLGYELVGKVEAEQKNFLDQTDLPPGAELCYRIVAEFQEPTGEEVLESLVSNESCIMVKADKPVITHADVKTTSETQGEVIVSWYSPFEVDQQIFIPPYSYQVFRSIGMTGEQDRSMVLETTDTTFTDMGLNTYEEIYNYTVLAYDSNGKEIGSSAVASTVWLEPIPEIGRITLNWQANVPWALVTPTYFRHYIYRDRIDESNPEELVLMDSVDVSIYGFQYIDEGNIGQELSDKFEYCYYVETFGSYNNPNILEPLINRSQIICARPNDTIPPCPPLNFSITNPAIENCNDFLATKPCSLFGYYNELNWEGNISGDCQNDIAKYLVLYSKTGEEDSFETIATVTEPHFEHPPQEGSFAGCYKIIAIDRSGNQSPPTETFCVENCTYYELPNVFTPNEDGVNDTFRPFDCPLFVKSVNFTVYNRWGVEVYSNKQDEEKSIYLEWNGTSNSGKKVLSGTYYYEAELEFVTFEPENNKQVLKGWVDVLY